MIPDDLTLYRKSTIMQGFGVYETAMLRDSGSRDCDIAILQDAACGTSEMWDVRSRDYDIAILWDEVCRTYRMWDCGMQDHETMIEQYYRM